jgi:hypothetical protein
MNFIVKFPVLIVISILATGCASVTGSRSQPVTLTSSHAGNSVKGAECILSNDKGKWYVTTPGSVVIRKAYGELAVDCKKEQLAGAKIFKSKNEAGVWGNIIAGGVVGYAIDAKSGAGFSYPSEMNVDLVKKTG